MSEISQSEWHWEQGIKFALESVRTLTFINGGAAIALMTYGTAIKSFSLSMKIALLVFAIGVACSTAGFLLGYKTQLEYGNAEIKKGREREETWRIAQKWNYATFFAAFSSLSLFIVGIITAALGL